MSIDEEPITPIDWDKPIETTEGLPARLLSNDYRVPGNTLMVVQIEHPSGSLARIFHENGIPYLAYPGKIRNRKTKREGWINIFPDQWVGCSHGSEEAARRHPNAKGAIATIKIEWEE
jgi:hypothetical protein